VLCVFLRRNGRTDLWRRPLLAGVAGSCLDGVVLESSLEDRRLIRLSTFSRVRSPVSSINASIRRRRLTRFAHDVLMRIGSREVKLTNLDKEFFPKLGLTKGDLIAYYVDVAPCLLHHVRRRPMQMLRYPDGVNGFRFYQKRVPEPHPDWLQTVHIKFPSGRAADFPVCDDAASLAWIVNLGCIDLHTWHSRVSDVERPDYLLIDLDPSEGNPWSHVPKIAFVVKEMMDELGLASFPKTSGSTGLHILAPIKPELPFPAVRDFAKALAQEVVRRIGDEDVATTTWKVADRRGVFVDYGQNARDRTIASAYSIRPTPDVRASAPLRWDEVPGCDPAEFTLLTMRDRVAEVGDLTKGMWRRKVSLLSRFETLGLEPPSTVPNTASLHRRARVARSERGS
jgi:bifunctional non-homologous end joining protein LigD